MSSVLNLRLARKRRDRAAREQAAAESRALHGRTKAEKQRDTAAAGKAVAFVEAHRRDAPDGVKG